MSKEQKEKRIITEIAQTAVKYIYAEAEKISFKSDKPWLYLSDLAEICEIDSMEEKKQILAQLGKADERAELNDKSGLLISELQQALKYERDTIDQMQSEINKLKSENDPRR